MKFYYNHERQLTINSGLVVLNPDQLRRRKHIVKQIEPYAPEPELTVCDIAKPVQFKKGELFGHDGSFGKGQDVELVGDDDPQVEPESEQTEAEPEQEAESEAEYPVHLGGAYWELSNGEKFQGKKAEAQQAEAELQE